MIKSVMKITLLFFIKNFSQKPLHFDFENAKLVC